MPFRKKKLGDPMENPLKAMKSIRYPKGFGGIGNIETKGIGFGGFEELGTPKQIGKKAKKANKVKDEEKPFDFFGGMKTDF